MKKLLSNWDCMRIFRLVLGIMAIAYAFFAKNYFFIALGGLLLFQAAVNLSCCGTQSCGSHKNKEKKGIYEDQIGEYKPD